jgi:DNA-binding MarR family transcriptional regulator
MSTNGNTTLQLLDREELGAWRGMLRVHAELTRALDAELTEAHGLPLSSYEVLLFLSDAPDGRMRMSELADSVLLSRSGLTRLVDRLERAGLLERVQCNEDARGYFAQITSTGREAFDAARRTHLDGVRRLFLSRFSREELRELGGLWERLLVG